jgi:hypothetical protein
MSHHKKISKLGDGYVNQLDLSFHIIYVYQNITLWGEMTQALYAHMNTKTIKI